MERRIEGYKLCTHGDGGGLEVKECIYKQWQDYYAAPINQNKMTQNKIRFRNKKSRM